jgi:hypothetical protein
MGDFASYVGQKLKKNAQYIFHLGTTYFYFVEKGGGRGAVPLIARNHG